MEKNSNRRLEFFSSDLFWLLSAQPFQHGRLAEFCQRAGLDLAHALAGDAEFAANLLERMGLAIAQAEAELQHETFARGEYRFEDALHFVFERLRGSDILWRGRFRSEERRV